MKKHFLFTSVPASGHVNPTLALVSELIDRGHSVSYAVGPEQFDAVLPTGAELVELPTRMPDLGDLRGRGPGPEHIERMIEFFVSDVRECLPILLDRFAENPPDAVCFDAMTAVGRMFADKLGLPAIALTPNFASNEEFDLRQVLAAEHAMPGGPAAADLAEIQEAMSELSEEFGVAMPPVFGGTPAELNLVFLPEAFQLRHETFDQRFRFIGPQLGDRENETYQPADPRRPLLFISLGTAFNERPDFYRSCLRAFGGTQWQVAMSVGTRVDVDALGEIPENFDVRPSFPQPAVLRHASAFVSHAGMNSTMESLNCAVPLVAVPQMPEQSANAARVEELGLGIELDPETASAAELRDAVDRVATDQRMRANLAHMRELVAASGGAPAGADALESHLS
ncbi:macrolide family glycosyltransferase [Saccharopolyspora griseoalba]|uniref:Macrolide family glycosyltransferase n=1 Tax=Saccharopolyspora griseoalba TaxID=1431848 RepID=A0ABW2LEQ2_9PSEU